MNIIQIEALDNNQYWVTDNRDNKCIQEEITINSQQWKDLTECMQYSALDIGYNISVNRAEQFSKEILSGKRDSIKLIEEDFE